MRRLKILSTLLFLPVISLLGQDLTNSVWNFGDNCRLDFSSGTAVASTSAIFTNEGCASISDENGNLLFYTDGTYIFRSDDSIIPGSENTLGGNLSASQSALIVPFPGNPGKYYIFTTAATLVGGVSGQYSGTTYAILDVNANSGLGELVQPITELLESSAELLTGIRSCATDEYWIVAHRWPGSDFYAWRLDESGLSSPVISTIGPSLSETGAIDGIGYIRASYDGTKLAWTRTLSTPASISLYDFDFDSGVISNEYIKEFPQNSLYGLCFSPDNSKLYTAEASPFGPSVVLQFNALATSQDEFSQSEVGIASTTKNFGAIENAPDGKMYIAQQGENRLSIIESPNEQGLDCSFQLDAFTLATGTTCRFGLQNIVSSPLVSLNTTLFSQDTIFACSTPYLLDIGNSFGGSIQWSTGDTVSSILISESDLYSIDLISPCINRNDSVYVSFDYSFSLSLPVDSALCNSSGNQVNAIYNFDDLDFAWSTGATTPGIFIENSGTYSVIASNEFCENSDSIKLTFISIPEFDLGNDSIYCNLDTLILDPEINAKTYLWSDGSTDETLFVTESGLYWLEVSDSICILSDSVNIAIYGKDSKVEIPNVFTPNQDGINDFFEAGNAQLEDYSMLIYNRWGTKVFSSSSPILYWDGQFENRDAPEGTYFWKCLFYDNCSQQSKEEKGSVTLLR